jgi:cytochrome c-type biogenesis protein CcmH/NrfG
MTHESVNPRELAGAWKPGQAYAMAVICLLIGLALGYLFRGSESRPAQASPANAASPPAADNTAMHAMPSLEEMKLEQMKQMAGKKAAPLLAKLQADPNNAVLLNQIGTIYKSTHQFKEAAEYYQRAVEADPKNVGARTDLASCLYYQGDVDGALSQLEQSLRYSPKDANSLFNLGMIRWQGKNDARGAISAWQLLLKTNPKLDAARSRGQELGAEITNSGLKERTCRTQRKLPRKAGRACKPTHWP